MEKKEPDANGPIGKNFCSQQRSQQPLHMLHGCVYTCGVVCVCTHIVQCLIIYEHPASWSCTPRLTMDVCNTPSTPVW